MNMNVRFSIKLSIPCLILQQCLAQSLPQSQYENGLDEESSGFDGSSNAEATNYSTPSSSTNPIDVNSSNFNKQNCSNASMSCNACLECNGIFMRIVSRNTDQSIQTEERCSPQCYVPPNSTGIEIISLTCYKAKSLSNIDQRERIQHESYNTFYKEYCPGSDGSYQQKQNNSTKPKAHTSDQMIQLQSWGIAGAILASLVGMSMYVVLTIAKKWRTYKTYEQLSNSNDLDAQLIDYEDTEIIISKIDDYGNTTAQTLDLSQPALPRDYFDYYSFNTQQEEEWA